MRVLYSCHRFAAALALSGCAALAIAAAPPTTPVVLELFTSQGCSSCPPADALAERFAADPALLVIARPVTYWDRLGWRDTLGRPANTALQRAYAARAAAGAGVYTPQLVVDGGEAAVGSDEAAVRRLVGRAQRVARPQLAITRNGDRVGVGVAGAPGEVAEVVLVGVASRVRVPIERGENAGRTITYTNVYMGERRLGGWAGGSRGYAIPRAALAIAGADRYVVLVRQPDGGRILAGRVLLTAR